MGCGKTSCPRLVGMGGDWERDREKAHGERVEIAFFGIANYSEYGAVVSLNH